MAIVKKTVAPVAAAKVEAPKAEVKKAAPTTPVKTETKTAVKEAEKAPVHPVALFTAKLLRVTFPSGLPLL